MGKCFQGLVLGTLMAFAYFSTNVSSYGGRWETCLVDALEWLVFGAVVTVCALTVYTIYRAVERIREHRR